MMWAKQAFVLFTSILVFNNNCHGARKINVRQQMEIARRSLSEDEVARGPREDTMGLGAGEALTPGKSMQTAKGMTKVKFEETYKGLPISGASVVFEEDASGAITGEAEGHLVAGLDDDIPDVTPQLSAKEAFHAATLKNHDNAASVEFDPEKDATLEVHLDDSLGDTANARLVYKLSYRIEKQGHFSRPMFLVDANTGDIIKQWEGLSFQRLRRREMDSGRVQSNYDFQTVGGNLKIGKANYDGKSYPKLEITKNNDGSCSLANNVAQVFHCNSSYDCYQEARTPYSFDCKELSDEINGAYSPLADALFYISSTYEMFDEWYGIKDPLKRSEEDTQSVCRARIHYGESYENAFWDGQFITFGDGNNTFYPLTSINVVAHEIAHGITEMNSGLIYQGESGGINEAFSDMAGEAVEFYANSKPDWMVGYEIFKHAEKALRYFVKPENDGSSIGDYKDFCPGINVHYSSGVFNRAFYFLGTTKGWDIKKAFKPFVVANVLYWMPSSRFYEAACGVVQATRDLGFNADDVIAAFRKVGVEPCKDTSSGILRTTDINVPEGHEVLIHINVTKEMDIETMRIHSYGGRFQTIVRTPNCEFCSRKTSWEGKIEVCDVVPGNYEISLTAQQEIVKGVVMLTGGSTKLLSNGTIKNMNDSIEFQFEFPEALVKRGGQVAMKSSSEYGYPIAVFRHGQPPDMNSYVFDFAFAPGDTKLVCNLKSGTYYGVIVIFYGGMARGIDIDVIDVLTGTRMDTPPAVTRPTSPFTLPTEGPSTTKGPTTPKGHTTTTTTTTPAPTEEGSGSGNGSGSDLTNDTEED